MTQPTDESLVIRVATERCKPNCPLCRDISTPCGSCLEDARVHIDVMSPYMQGRGRESGQPDDSPRCSCAERWVFHEAKCHYARRGTERGAGARSSNLPASQVREDENREGDAVALDLESPLVEAAVAQAMEEAIGYQFERSAKCAQAALATVARMVAEQQARKS